MSQFNPSTTSVQQAAAFFSQPVWSRLFNALYEKYMAQGRIGGQVILHACTVEEQREIARFLQRKVPASETCIVRLQDMQRALHTSGFPCELADLLLALYPERSHLTRPQARTLRAQSQERFSAELQAHAESLPTLSRGKRWLLEGAHGHAYLFHRYKNEKSEVQATLQVTLNLVLDALDQLPIPPTYERLAVFARHVGGDPHCLDAQVFSGRLFLYALQDLALLDEPLVSQAFALSEETVPSSNNAMGTEESATLQAQQRLFLYYDAGLLTDTISSTVAVFYLGTAMTNSGQNDPLVRYAGASVLILPLRQLLAWQNLAPASPHVYLFENPQVFEDIIDGLQRSACPLEICPTLVCTSGWPSAATLQLLNLLITTKPDVVLHYSGDFDLPGLRIAAYLQKRYPAHCQLWHFDPASYLAALHAKSTSLAPADYAALQSLPVSFAPLIASIRERKQKAYQEGITNFLLEDVLIKRALF